MYSILIFKSDYRLTLAVGMEASLQASVTTGSNELQIGIDFAAFHCPC